MNVLVIGSGGREHALCWAIGASPLCEALYCAPGNGGIARDAECVALDTEDFSGVVAWCRDRAIDFVVVGPEAPLVSGITDFLEDAGIACFGPSAAAARLEGSKAFAKDLCRRHGIPTPDFARFTDFDAARAYVRRHGAPLVVKASGLAAGKGVTVAHTLDEAEAALDAMAAGAFGAAGSEVIVETFLDGRGSERIRPRGRYDCIAPGGSAGSQGDRRWRRGAEHWRDGCLLARAGARRRHAGARNG